jgi:transposase
MQVLYPRCCGVDVHVKTIVVCLIVNGHKEIRTFGTMTTDLSAFRDWLVAAGCTHVALESTGVYWRPVYNMLEGVVEVLLVNARHVKTVPGRKTDVRDCEWLADLLRHGLLKGSFIPPLPIRELRELTRYRQGLIRDQTALANRIQKVLEMGNVKLGQVATDVLGVSGRRMLRALVAGVTNGEQLADLALGTMRRKIPTLQLALQGQLTPAQRYVLKELLDCYEATEAAIARVSDELVRIVEHTPDGRVRAALDLVQSVPGVGPRIAEILIAEIGVEMRQFPSAGHLASWAGLCPGNNESAGKQRHGTTTKGSPYLRTALVQAAWAAIHVKESRLARLYGRLGRRIGWKRALIAVAHRMLVILYRMLLDGVVYEERDDAPVSPQRMERLQQRLIERLEGLGLNVTVSVRAQAP